MQQRPPALDWLQLVETGAFAWAGVGSATQAVRARRIMDVAYRL
jgi:hypothetical protein